MRERVEGTENVCYIKPMSGKVSGCNIYRRQRGEARGVRANEGRSVNLVWGRDIDGKGLREGKGRMQPVQMVRRT